LPSEAQAERKRLERVYQKEGLTPSFFLFSLRHGTRTRKAALVPPICKARGAERAPSYAAVAMPRGGQRRPKREAQTGRLCAAKDAKSHALR